MNDSQGKDTDSQKTPAAPDVPGKKLRNEIAAVREARDFTDAIVATIREPLIILDEDMKVRFANSAFYEKFKTAPEETEGVFLHELGNRQWNIPSLRTLLEKILPKKTALDNFEVRHDFPGIGFRIMLLNARQVVEEKTQQKRILLAFEDITEKKLAEEQMQQAYTEMEQRVEERTFALKLTNERLTEELQSHASTIQELKITSEELEKMNYEYREVIAKLQGINEDLHARTERFKKKSEEEVHRADEFIRKLRELNETELLLEMVLSSLTVAAVLLNRSYTVLRWNRAAERLWGRTEQEMTMRSILYEDAGFPEKDLRSALDSAQAQQSGRLSVILPARTGAGDEILCRFTIRVLPTTLLETRFLLFMEQVERP